LSSEVCEDCLVWYNSRNDSRHNNVLDEREKGSYLISSKTSANGNASKVTELMLCLQSDPPASKMLFYCDSEINPDILTNYHIKLDWIFVLDSWPTQIPAENNTEQLYT
jgi:hypothetical protein